MKYTKPGRSDLTVSRTCMGCMGFEGAAKAADLELTDEETAYLEELYVPHPLAGVMAQNKPEASNEKHVWSIGDQKLGGR